jgi:hypothetical protein
MYQIDTYRDSRVEDYYKALGVTTVAAKVWRNSVLCYRATYVFGVPCLCRLVSLKHDALLLQ